MKDPICGFEYSLNLERIEEEGAEEKKEKKKKKRNNPGCFDEMRIKKRKGLGSWGKFLHEGVLMLRNHVRACGF